MNVLPGRKARTNLVVIFPYLAFAGGLVLGGALLAGCGKNVNASISKQQPPMKVTVVKAEQSDVPLTSEWVGTLDGYVNAQIHPQASGYLTQSELSRRISS
jgi:membrane fusion protein (multidrug efflux system)